MAVRAATAYGAAPPPEPIPHSSAAPRIYPGRPLGPAKLRGTVWTRLFTRGTVWVDPSAATYGVRQNR